MTNDVLMEIAACRLAYEQHSPHYDELLILLGRCATEIERLRAQVAHQDAVITGMIQGLRDAGAADEPTEKSSVSDS